MERCTEAGRTEEKRAVKSIGKIKTIDYKRELEALAIFSYKTEHQDSFVKFIGWYDTDRHIHIVMDLHELGSLDGYLASAQYSFLEADVKLIVTQILEALAYMHKLRFMHRDLKPANVLVVTTEPQGWVKIADFGFSKRAARDHAAMQTGEGTPLYMAPEMQGLVRDSKLLEPGKVSYSSGVDIWAVGIMTHQIFTGRTPFRTGELASYSRGSLAFPTSYLTQSVASDAACVFVQHLTTPQPNERPSARECLATVWLREEMGRSLPKYQFWSDSTEPSKQSGQCSRPHDNSNTVIDGQGWIYREDRGLFRRNGNSLAPAPPSYEVIGFPFRRALPHRDQKRAHHSILTDQVAPPSVAGQMDADSAHGSKQNGLQMHPLQQLTQPNERGYKRSATISKITDRMLGRSSPRGSDSGTPGEKRDRRHPPVSIKNTIGNQDENRRTLSTDNRRISFQSLRENAGAPDESRRNRRRFSFLPRLPEWQDSDDGAPGALEGSARYSPAPR